MDFEHIIPVEDSKPKKKKGFGLVIFSGIFALILFIGGVSYFAGTKSSTPLIKENLQPETLGVETEDAPTPQPLYKKRADVTTEITPEKSPTPEDDVFSEVLGANSQTKIIKANPSLDGFITNTGTIDYIQDIKAGTDKENKTRGFVSFDLSTIPQGANVTKATLRLYQAKTIGDLFTNGNALVVDNLDYGGTLDANDYSIPANHSAFATMTGSKDLGWKEVDITEIFMENYEMGLVRSQYRLRFTNETKPSSELDKHVTFESADNYLGTNYTPEIILMYTQ